eukprot:694631-Amphidinium_carterae.1
MPVLGAQSTCFGERVPQARLLLPDKNTKPARPPSPSSSATLSPQSEHIPVTESTNMLRKNASTFPLAVFFADALACAVPRPKEQREH